MGSKRDGKARSFRINRKKVKNPAKLTRNEINKAVREFLDNGGQIKKIENVKRSYQ